jgi:hypothetical protein
MPFAGHKIFGVVGQVRRKDQAILQGQVAEL